MLEFILAVSVVTFIWIVFKLGRGWEVIAIHRELQESGVSERKYGDFNKFTIKITGSACEYKT